MSQHLVIPGGWLGWEYSPSMPLGVKEDAIWRATPNQLRKAILFEIWIDWKRLVDGSPDLILLGAPEEENKNRSGNTEFGIIHDLSG